MKVSMIFKIDKIHRLPKLLQKKENWLENIDALDAKCNKRNNLSLHLGISTGIVW